jgi:hypothetical protein
VAQSFSDHGVPLHARVRCTRGSRAGSIRSGSRPGPRSAPPPPPSHSSHRSRRP